jgi:hypothetical protein
VHLLEGVAALLSAEDHTTVPNDLRDRLRELVRTIRSRIEADSEE